MQRTTTDLVRLLVVVTAVLCAWVTARAGGGLSEPPVESCGPVPLPASTAPNIFNDEQQVILGDVMAEITNDRMESIDDPELTGYLQRIGERILRHLPPSRLNYRFYLADWPVANALSMSGGRVYVTRKLVANARDEDELAGVVGHELGHIVTHQQAIDWTAFLNKALSATSVSDRKDIEDKVQRMFEFGSLWKLRSVTTKRELEQQDADRVGMEAVVRAGYRPEAIADFFDRVTENKGKKGSWFSEAFQTTPPNAKRYREMLKLLPHFPAACRETLPSNTEDEFRAWKRKVAAYRGTGRRESVHGVLVKRELQPALQDEMRTLRFSPNGKYLLAQDSGTIYVGRRDPPEALFQFSAPDAYPVMFTADSSEVLVYDHAMRIERWNIESQERTDIYEVSSATGCSQFTVSPDGNTLACLDGRMNLALIDTETNERFFERKDFHHWSLESNSGWRLNFALSASTMGFSPDGSYFLAASGTSKPVAYDLKKRSEMSLPGSITEMLKHHFTFLGPDRIAGMVGTVGEKSRVVRFPSGEVLNNINTGIAEVSAAAHGDYLLLRPIEGYAVGVLDINKNTVVRANTRRAFDAYDDTFLSELGSGEIGLFQKATTPVATLKLPRGRLGRLEAFAVTPDLHWLAISGNARGAVWDLTSGTQLYNVKGFQGCYVGPDGFLYVDFPKQEKSARSIVRVGLQARGMELAYSLGDDDLATEHGKYLTRVRPIEEKAQPAELKARAEVFAKARGDFRAAHFVDVLQHPARHVVLDVKDTRTGTLLWSRRFDQEMPAIDLQAGAMVLRWHYDDDGAKTSMRDAPEKERLHGEHGDYLLEVLDAATGAVRGRVLVGTSKGIFRVTHAYAAGERIFVTDSRARIFVYLLKDGSVAGRMFGTLRAVSGDGTRFCVQHERGRLTVYDAASLAQTDEFSFTQPAAALRFLGKGLFVLTANQTAYALELR